MSEDEELVQVLKEWIVKAENDLTTAIHTLLLKERAPTDTICFHAQQCIEKYLKSILVLRKIDFPKTHDLKLLMKMIPEADRPNLDWELQDQLTRHATTLRYPDFAADPSLWEARKAVATARRVRKEVRRLMPRAALRRKKK